MRGATSVSVVDCTFSNNTSGTSGGGLLAHNSPVTITGCSFVGNDARWGGGLRWLAFGMSATLENCSFAGNHATEEGGAVNASRGSVSLANCTLANNTAFGIVGAGFGGAIYCSAGIIALSSCELSGNSANQGGAVWGRLTTGTIDDCTFHDNGAGLGGVMYWTVSSPTISGCTLAQNSAAVVSGLVALQNTTAVISNTIIAMNVGPGESVFCDAGSLPILSCVDIFGNEGGDWTGCVAGQLGINGNFSADPVFCAPAADDFTLAEISPCAPAHSPAGCGLIGSLPVACVGPIGIADEEAAPSRPTTLRVWPNPVASATAWIEWTVPLGGSSLLKLYDAQGRLVLSRPAGGGEGGLQRLTWFELTGGSRIAAGVYFLDAGVGRMERVILLR